MATESTLLIVKPDGVRRGLVGEVLRRIEAKGLSIEQMRLCTIARETAERHYDEHRDKPFFGELVDFITSGPVVVAKITGDDAIACWRALMGPNLRPARSRCSSPTSDDCCDRVTTASLGR